MISHSCTCCCKTTQRRQDNNSGSAEPDRLRGHQVPERGEGGPAPWRRGGRQEAGEEAEEAVQAADKVVEEAACGRRGAGSGQGVVTAHGDAVHRRHEQVRRRLTPLSSLSV